MIRGAAGLCCVLARQGKASWASAIIKVKQHVSLIPEPLRVTLGSMYTRSRKAIEEALNFGLPRKISRKDNRMKLIQIEN